MVLCVHLPVFTNVLRRMNEFKAAWWIPDHLGRILYCRRRTYCHEPSAREIREVIREVHFRDAFAHSAADTAGESTI
jgi:hypothetical protein